jgi:hypothetical protein
MVIEKKKLVIIFCRFLLKSSIFLSGCASPGEGNAGFAREYPWTYTPFKDSPSNWVCSFNDIIDLQPFISFDSRWEQEYYNNIYSD